MADWYVSSAVYATIPGWQASPHAYSVGDLVKPTAAISSSNYNSQWVFRVTVAGTSGATEPNWSTATSNNATIASGGVTFQNVTGQSTYGWSAATTTLATVSSARAVAGDRIFMSSDHSESLTVFGGLTYNFNNSTSAFGMIQIISVNRAGSVPPVAADIQNGAVVSYSNSGGAGQLVLEAYCNLFWQGVVITAAGTGTASHLYFNSSARKAHYLKDCVINLTSALAASRITTGNAAKVTFDNTNVQFGATGQTISTAGSALELHWINTPSAIQGSTLPTTLFRSEVTAAPVLIICRGVDLSAITGTLVTGWVSGSNIKALFEGCKIASGVTRLAAPGTGNNSGDEVELVGCYDGTNVLNERYTYAGVVTTDRSTTMSGGAADDIGAYSLKMVSNANSDFCTFSLDKFWMDIENVAIGSSKTATVELISSASLNNNDIRLALEYQGTAGSSLAKVDDSLASVLTAASALPSSSVTWSNAPSTPQKQQLQVTFTPQVAGRVRGLVRLGKTSKTVWVNPQIAIT